MENKKLKIARGKAHTYFDRIWQSKLMTRKQAYVRLKTWMNINNPNGVHIKHFSKEKCYELIEILKVKYPSLYDDMSFLDNDLFYS